MKIRCPVCGGSGAVEPTFGSGCVYCPGQSIAVITSTKVCPACGGSGIQDETPPSFQKFNSTELLLLAHDEWKRREERKHNHPEDHWVAGFLQGFCTSRSWARDYVDSLLKQEGGL